MPSKEPRYIYGMHDPEGEQPMIEMGTLGWILFDERVFASPDDHHGKDFSPWADRGFGIVARINYDYFPKGTIPLPEQYDAFAQRVGRFVRNSRGCHIWIIGNEMNHEQERPDGQIITPQQYAVCYAKCWHQIHTLPGHEQDQVVTGAIGPWNATTKYPGNESGDWVQYFVDMIKAIRDLGCPLDGIAHHAYTQGKDPELIFSEDRMVPHFPQYRTHFRCYQDFMNATPRHLRHVPVYITESNRNSPWDDVNSGWVQNAYQEIDRWNNTPGNQQIRCLVLYRWVGDQWSIKGKGKVLDDWRAAMRHKYAWRQREYRTTFLGHDVPQVVPSGEVLIGDVRIRNDSFMLWPALGPHPVRLGYRWFKDGQSVQAQDIRTPLPHDVPSGETVTLPAQAMVPQGAGRYVLQWDLVHEHVTWFSSQGNRPLNMRIEVRPAGEVTKPAIDNITDQLPKHSTKTYETRSLAEIRYLVIHHSAVRASVGPDLFARYHVYRGLPGIRYHFVIGEKGEIWQTNALTTTVLHAAPVDVESVGICICGNLLNASPLPEQMDSLGRLCAWLLRELDLTSAQQVVRGRKEFILDDPNYDQWSKRDPGDEWDAGARWKDTLLAKIAAVQRGAA